MSGITYIYEVEELLNKYNYNETTLEEEKTLLWKMESIQKEIQNSINHKEQEVK